MNILTMLIMSTVLLYHSFGYGLPGTKATEKLVEENILKNFVDIANDPTLYINQKITEFKNKNQNKYNPDGGIKTPVQRKNLEIMTLASIWDNQKYCAANGECVTVSYKRILIITIPTKVCGEFSCTEDKIIFTMKGGIKTTCSLKDSLKCIDSTILYLPEEMSLAPVQ